MTSTLSIGEVTALLLDERFYSNPLRPKTFYKLLYFADKELDDIGLNTDVQHFWYKFGTMAKTGGSPVTVESSDDGREVRCSLSAAQVSLRREEETKARLALSRVLNRLYEQNTEGLTDDMYEEAPYDVQRHYRRLDKQLSDATDDKPDYPEVDPSREAVIDTVFHIIDTFPVDDYPWLEEDLDLWYSVVSAELDAEEYRPQKALKISELFWTIFCIDLAQRENTGLAPEEIAEELDTQDLEGRQEDIRKELELIERERSRLHTDLEENHVVSEAADGVAIALLGLSPTP
ncbi:MULTISPECIES: hypothetical protein [Salinibaculum]|uniref:hypothetical protein n=1 Tax=Salinibaculum TaxID=2732368 RepID=UPI0030D60380